MTPAEEAEAVVDQIKAAQSWNGRVALIRRIPETFGESQRPAIYAAVAEAVYVPQLAPDFAYIHWREEYELPHVERAYEKAIAQTNGFTRVTEIDLVRVLRDEPSALLVFRLFLGFTPQEFAAATALTAEPLGLEPLSKGTIGSMESGTKPKGRAVEIAAAVIDRAMRGVLFSGQAGDVRSKIAKPDTAAGWDSVRKYAAEGVPLPVFLHQRHYGGAFRQLLDATSGKRGDLLEQVVEELFAAEGIQFIRTGASNQAMIAKRFGLTVKPAPDFVVHDGGETVRAILECKQVNDGGTARDKAARFGALRKAAERLGGFPVFAILAGLGWRRTADALGPVVRDTDGRVFTVKSLSDMMTVEPFPALRGGATRTGDPSSRVADQPPPDGSR